MYAGVLEGTVPSPPVLFPKAEALALLYAAFKTRNAAPVAVDATESPAPTVDATDMPPPLPPPPPLLGGNDDDEDDGDDDDACLLDGTENTWYPALSSCVGSKPEAGIISGLGRASLSTCDRADGGCTMTRASPEEATVETRAALMGNTCAVPRAERASTYRSFMLNASRQMRPRVMPRCSRKSSCERMRCVLRAVDAGRMGEEEQDDEGDEDEEEDAAAAAIMGYSSAYT